MYAGRKVEEAPVADVSAQPQHPYTVGLLGSVRRDRRPQSGGLEAPLESPYGALRRGMSSFCKIRYLVVPYKNYRNRWLDCIHLSYTTINRAASSRTLMIQELHTHLQQVRFVKYAPACPAAA